MRCECVYCIVYTVNQEEIKMKMRIVIMYDTLVSNEFTRVGGWKNEHLLSHHGKSLSQRVAAEMNNEPQENAENALQLTLYDETRRKSLFFSHTTESQVNACSRIMLNSLILLVPTKRKLLCVLLFSKEILRNPLNILCDHIHMPNVGYN